MDSVNIALVGNPNVGKSTLFNALTGLRQHTGNWPGKTVETAVGRYSFRGMRYRVTDLPGLYSLQAKSPEEAVAAEFLRGGESDCALILCDATCLARSLILALQALSLTRRAVLALNLTDEARRRGIATDAAALERILGIPVVEISAARREGLDRLKEALRQVCDGFVPVPAAPDRDPGSEAAARRAKEIARQVQTRPGREQPWRRRLDRLLLSRAGGYPAAAVLLLAVLWLTIRGSNAPGIWLEWLFARFGIRLSSLMRGLPGWMRGLLLDGVYATVARVITVMLPPMAIFFPLFTLLEDFGLLPRLAFLTDRPFERCGACGKQALTACMSLGCNAVGGTGCRIIDSPRERLLAILTCSLMPCNGRFPTLILLGAMIAGGGGVLPVACFLALSVTAVLLTSGLLSRTVLRGAPSGYVMELPPYRVPRVGQVLLRSFLDRTLGILGRAAAIAAPAGALIWLLDNTGRGGVSLLVRISRWLEPVGGALGLSGPILLAFLLGFPANELVLPVLAMISPGPVQPAPMQAVCMALFCLFHWPCGPTVLTVWRETRSLRWTLWSVLLPTAVGSVLCLTVRMLWPQ